MRSRHILKQERKSMWDFLKDISVYDYQSFKIHKSDDR